MYFYITFLRDFIMLQGSFFCSMIQLWAMLFIIVRIYRRSIYSNIEMCLLYHPSSVFRPSLVKEGVCTGNKEQEKIAPAVTTRKIAHGLRIWSEHQHTKQTDIPQNVVSGKRIYGMANTVTVRIGYRGSATPHEEKKYGSEIGRASF